MKYEDARKLISNCDLMFCRGNYALSGIIREFTNSEVNHVGMLFWEYDRLMVIEASEDYGYAVIHPFSDYFNNFAGTGKPYDGEIIIGKMKDLCTTPILKELCRNEVMNKAYSLLGVKYDKESIAKIAINKVFSTKFENKDIEKSLFCSEYVYVCFKEVCDKMGVYFEHDNGYVYPEHIYNMCDTFVIDN